MSEQGAIWLLGPRGHNATVDTIYATLPPLHTHLRHITSYTHLFMYHAHPEQSTESKEKSVHTQMHKHTILQCTNLSFSYNRESL